MGDPRRGSTVGGSYLSGHMDVMVADAATGVNGVVSAGVEGMSGGELLDQAAALAGVRTPSPASTSGAIPTARCTSSTTPAPARSGVDHLDPHRESVGDRRVEDGSARVGDGQPE